MISPSTDRDHLFAFKAGLHLPNLKRCHRENAQRGFGYTCLCSVYPSWCCIFLKKLRIVLPLQVIVTLVILAAAPFSSPLEICSILLYHASPKEPKQEQLLATMVKHTLWVVILFVSIGSFSQHCQRWKCQDALDILASAPCAAGQ